MIPSSKRYPGTTPLWMLWKAPQLSCPTIQSCKKDGPAYFILIAHYLQHRNLAGIRGVLIQSSRSRRQITISIADCCFARVTTQWGLRIPLLQSCFARKTENRVQDDKWPLPIWPWGCTCWHNFNLPFKQALQHLNVPVQTITCLLASKNEFHNFTRYGLQTEITSSTWAKVFQVYKAFHQRLGFFKCRQTRTTSVAYYILTEISTGILLLLPSQQLKSQLLLLSSLVVPPALSNQIDVWWALIKGLFKHLKLDYVDGT